MRHDQAKSNSAGETWAPPVRSATSGDPAFNEPWEAQAFALAATLSARGCYTWSEWSSELAEQLRVPEKTDGGDRNVYYLCWLMTLEKLAVAKGVVESSALEARKHEWVEAFQSTPHGHPVELKRITSAPGRSDPFASDARQRPHVDENISTLPIES